MEKGDFTCGPDGLTLEPRLVYTFFILVDLLGSVNTSFNRSEDGYLVMDSDLGIIGHNIYYMGARRFGAWVRWKPTTWDEVAISTPTSTVLSGKTDIADLTQGEILASAAAGDSKAQIHLYSTSREPNRYIWLCRSADHGLAEAAYRIGRLYHHGQEGLPRDNARAYLWYRLASIGGHSQAKIELEDMLSEMSAEQIDEAGRLFHEWKPGQCELEFVSDSPYK